MKGYLIAGIFAALIIGSLGGYWKGRADGDMSADVTAKQGVIDRQSLALKNANETARAAEALAAETQAIADARLKELTNAKATNARLLADVDAGRVRLTIAGTCTASGRIGGDDAGMDHGATCELAAGARRHYQALIDGIDHEAAKLLAAQGRIRALERYASVCMAPE